MCQITTMDWDDALGNTDILGYVISHLGTSSRSTHATYVNMFKAACVNKQWQGMVTHIQGNSSWNSEYLSNAAEFISNIFYLYSTQEYNLIVSGLRHFLVLKKPLLQMHGITALHIMTTTANVEDNDRILRSILYEGAVHAVVGAMIMNPRCVPLHIVCCRMISNFCDFNHGIDDPEELWSLAQVTVVTQQIIDTMKCFPQEIDVQRSSIQCLAKLCTYQIEHIEDHGKAQACRDEVLKNDGIQCLTSMIYAYDHPLLHIDIGKLLALFTSDSVDIVMNEMKVNLHTHNKPRTLKLMNVLAIILNEEAWAIQLMSRVPDAIQIFIQVYMTRGTYDQIGNASVIDMENYDNRIQCAVCQGIARVAYVSGLENYVVQAGAVTLLVGVIQETDSAESRVAACIGLANIATIDCDESMLIHKAGGLQALLIMFVRYHTTDVNSIFEGCEVLFTLTEFPKYRKIMRELGYVSAIETLTPEEPNTANKLTYRLEKCRMFISRR